MAWEEISDKSVPCPCGKGFVKTTIMMDDWNRTNTVPKLDCANCETRYEFKTFEPGIFKPQRECNRTYLVRRDYPPYKGSCELSSFGPKNRHPKDFYIWLIENETKRDLEGAREQLESTGNCSHVKGVARKIVEQRRKLYHSAKAKELVTEIDEALRIYDSYDGNEERRRVVRDAEQLERSVYLDEFKKNSIPVG